MKRLLVFWVFGASAVARADVKLPAIFGDHMVLQEGRPVPFWGTAAPGERVTVTAAGASGAAVADGQGRWRVNLPAFTAREPFTVTIAGTNTVSLSDVVTGEVWLGSGQSNMEWPLARARDAEAEIARASHPRMRLFLVRHGATLPETAGDVVGEWVVCSPETAPTFSAVAYFFGRELVAALDRPVGLIADAWGGTPAEAWTSRAALAANPKLGPLQKLAQRSPAANAAEIARYKDEIAAWEKANSHTDPGNRGEQDGWARPGIPETGWRKLQAPGHWEEQGLAVDGAVWYRKEVELPPAFVGRPLYLHLGVVNDCDMAYVGGERVGATCHETAMSAALPRVYEIPAALAKPGRLLVAVRVFDERGRGGFSSHAGALRISTGRDAGDPHVPLAGRWNVRTELELPPLSVRWDERPKPPPAYPDPMGPAHLWEHLVVPLVPFSIRGVIWYQGEANVERAHQYQTLFPTLIADWRRAFEAPTLPFLFVQLAGFHPRWPGPGHDSPAEWAELREAQAMALALPGTGMAVALDVGDRDDIHPTNKQEVGRRLALLARKQVYGQADVVAHGPTFVAARPVAGGLRVEFAHAEGLRIGTRGEPLMGFEVAGPDRRFYTAAARIDGSAVIVSAPNVKRPVAVRYAWSDAPVANLVNGAGLPAAPFRSDRWPGATVGRE